MLFSILKDSLIVFLLVYALLTLGENFCNFLGSILEKPPFTLTAYYIIDIRNIPPGELEIPLKYALKSTTGNVLIVIDDLSEEADYIVSAIEKDNKNIHRINHKDLQKISGSPKETADFFYSW